MLAGFLACLPSLGLDSRGIQFVGWTDFGLWQQEEGTRPGCRVLVSPVLQAELDWQEGIVSWNVQAGPGAGIEVQARALWPGRSSRYYTLGCWSPDGSRQPRCSVPGQKDGDGDVDTDTLVLARPCRQAQVRITLATTNDIPLPRLEFVGLSLLDRHAAAGAPALPPNREAWGRVLQVPERSQADYPGGADEWCSPTSISMVLGYWAQTLHRPELERQVPEVAQGVYDPRWPGTGNWPFNTAYAGSFTGVRAYVTRLSDVAELEDWVAGGVPVTVSVCYEWLRGRERTRSSGHLVVVVGFTETGDVIVNDPGTRENVRKTFPRAHLVRAWTHSRNTVYLIHPAHWRPPGNARGHWYAPGEP